MTLRNAVALLQETKGSGDCIQYLVIHGTGRCSMCTETMSNVI